MQRTDIRFCRLSAWFLLTTWFLLSLLCTCDAQTLEEGVCARVRIRISQDAVIARNAFKATLEISNSPENVPLENLKVTLNITDSNSQPANDLFGIHPPELSGVGDINGAGVIQPGGTATATWLLLPTRDAAPDLPVTYYVGGEFSYTQSGSTITMPLFPAPILVKPDPLLVLDYFLVRDVFSDDPFTPEIEPAEPFPLGLMVRNNGKGVANNFRITSSQPEIIENEKGLLIDFKIIGTQVNSDPVSPSLTANLGNIDPGTTSVAKWMMTTTLQGKFIEYKATFEHVDGLGMPLLSIIDTVNIHELTHAVRVDTPSDDNKPDFLVNDIADDDHLPDTLYNSTGPVEEVNIGLNPSVDWQMVGDHPEATLIATVPTGWVYIRAADPGQDQFKLKRVVRSDGREIRVDDNAWTTHRTIRLVGQSPYREHILHLFDKDSTGSYTLVYEISGADGDLDGDGFSLSQGDCNDNDKTVYPGAPEICDGKDNNCNGQTDEGFDAGALCSSGIGACITTGIKVCSPDGLSTICNAVAGMPSIELCGDNIDNNCDGQKDEGFDVGADCSAGVGECKAYGAKVCSADGLSTVCNAVAGNPTEEVCGDNIDNDCDDEVDDQDVCNLPPVANAGPDQNVVTKTLVTLDGSGSYDPESAMITFLWSFTEVPAGSTITNASLSDVNSAKPTFTPDVDGTYRLRLLVNDGMHNSEPDEVSIFASTPNVAPNANAGPDQNVHTGTMVALDGSGSNDPDNGPQPLSYLWSFMGVPQACSLTDNDITDRNKPLAGFVPDVDGTYMIKLTVSDSDLSSSDDVIVISTTPNVPPNANAGADITVMLPEKAVLNGSASNDPDNGPDALTYSWRFVSVPAGSLLGNDNISGSDTVSPFFTPDVVGTYVLELMVSDGIEAAYDNVAITVIVQTYRISGGAYNFPQTATYKASFSLDVTGPSSSSGWLKYYYARTRMNFVSTAITSVSVSGNTATISGTGTVNGAAGYTFTATITDGAPDKFGITIKKSDGSVYYSAGPGNTSGGDLIILLL